MPKIIIVTGASSGLGFAMAKQLLQDGNVVYCLARRVEMMKGLETLGGKIISLDISSEKSIKEAIKKISKQTARIDVLINNAGYGLYGAVEDITLKQARDQFEVNLFGLAALTKEILPVMRRQGFGKIINISSMGGKVYTPLGAWYHATKHALEGWSDCLRLELKEFGIDVVIVEPGVIKTAFGQVAGEPILKNSGKGVYARLARAMAKSVSVSYSKDGDATNPEVVARKISQIVDSKKVKTRYVVGYLARPLMMVRKYLGDNIYDRVILAQVR
jgi:short-subunit dehydrogenase